MANTASHSARPDKLPEAIPRPLSAVGHKQEQRQSGTTRLQFRDELARLLLNPPPGQQHHRRELAGLAADAGWPLPVNVTVAAVRSPANGATAGHGRSGATGPEPLGGDVLAGLAGPHPCLIIPETLPRGRGPELAGTVEGSQVAIGLAVPLGSAPDSLRWARRALALAEAGVIADEPLLWCEDHLVTLCLMADPKLADHLVRQQLGMLTDLTPRQRARAIDTLGPWLERRGTAAEIAGLLNVHPQTVRYRIRRFERSFGDRLSDPDGRFGIEVALRLLNLLKQPRGTTRNPKTSGG